MTQFQQPWEKQKADFGVIRRRVFFLVLIVIGPVLILTLFGSLAQLRTEKKRIAERAVFLSELGAARLQHYVQNGNQLLQTLTQFSFLVLSTNKQFCETHFANLKLLSPDYEDFGLIEKNGLLFCNANPAAKTARQGVAAVFHKTLEKAGFAVTNMETNRAGIPVLLMGLPVQGASNEFHRVLFASLRKQVLEKALADVPTPDEAMIRLLDAAGNVLATSAGARHKPLSASVFHRIQSIGKGVLEIEDGDGISSLHGTTTVAGGREPAFHVLVSIPASVGYAPVYQRLVLNLLALALVALGVLYAARIYATRSLLLPLDGLVSAATRLSEGDLSTRIKMTGDRSELGHLAATFDSMAEKLEKRHHELREANEQVKHLNAELEERVNERTAELKAVNEELEAFSFSVSHDLRTPLRHINGFLELVLEDGKSTIAPDSRRHLELISRASQRMGHLIEDLLNFSRTGQQTISPRPLSFNALVAEVMADLQKGGDGSRVNLKVHPLPEVEGDRSLLRQVWLNLISNAIKYSRGKETPQIDIGSYQDGKEFIFYIRDNGAGFDMEYAHRLFGVFQRLHREQEFEGTGIGLANVRRIVNRHKGRTWATGKVGEGATFYFSLPCTRPDTIRSAPVQAAMIPEAKVA